MSTKPVIDTVSREAQIADLANVLRCSDAFQRLRGTVGGDIMEFFDGCLKESDPSAARRMWRQLMKNLETMLGTCAMLRSDGKEFAVMELRRALIDPGYIVAGEPVWAWDDTTLFTVFAVDPDATFRMDKLFQDWRTPFPDDTDYYVVVPDFWEKYEDENFVKDRYGPELLPLFQAVNWGVVHGRGLSTSSRPIPLRIFHGVVKAFGARVVDIKTRRVGKRTMEFSPWGFPRGEMPTLYAQLAGNSRQYSSSSCYFGKAVGQSELLGAFSPADQERLATWELRLPTAMVGDKHVYTVCVRPEAEHAHWRLVRPQFTSDVAHGHFVTVTPIAWRDRVFAGEELHRLRLYQNSRIFR